MFFKDKTPCEKEITNFKGILGNLGLGCLPYKPPGLSHVLLSQLGWNLWKAVGNFMKLGVFFSRDLRQINFSDIERMTLSA